MRKASFNQITNRSGNFTASFDGEYLTLLQSDISNINDLWKLSFEKISEILGQDRALELEKHLPT